MDAKKMFDTHIKEQQQKVNKRTKLRPSKVAIITTWDTFDPNVITRECVMAGIDLYTAADVVEKVRSQIHGEISTEKLHGMVLDTLDESAIEPYHSAKGNIAFVTGIIAGSIGEPGSKMG